MAPKVPPLALLNMVSTSIAPDKPTTIDVISRMTDANGCLRSAGTVFVVEGRSLAARVVVVWRGVHAGSCAALLLHCAGRPRGG